MTYGQKMNRSYIAISGKSIERSNHIIVDERTTKQLFADRVSLTLKGKSMRLRDEEGKEVVIPPRADIAVNFFER